MSKVLIISPCGTHPPSEGNRQRVLSLAEALKAAGHEVHMALLPNNKFESGDAQAMLGYWSNRLHILYPFYRWTPGFRLRRFAARLFDPIMRRLLAIAPPGSRIASIDEIYFDWWDVQLMALNWRYRFDVAFAEYVFVSRALKALPGDVRRVIDTHDIFSGRDDALRNTLSIDSDWLSTDPQSEGHALDRADVVLGIQDEESQKLRALTTRIVTTVGHFIEPVTDNRAKPVAGRLLFVGSSNPINVDGCAWFIDHVLERVLATVGSTHLRIVGGVGAALAERYPQRRQLEFAGRVDDLDTEYASAEVVINPVRFGTGLAIKSIEALAHGCALLCSPEGARGVRLNSESPPPCVVAADAEEFAQQTIALLSDIQYRDVVQSAARDFVEHWNRQQADNLARVIA